MNIKKLALLFAVASLMTGCNAIASKTNMLTDDTIKSQAGGTLGYDPSELTIVSKRTEGTNTYVSVKTKNNQQFNCIINGGNLLTFGMTTPPSCAKKGEAIRSSPLGG